MVAGRAIEINGRPQGLREFIINEACFQLMQEKNNKNKL